MRISYWLNISRLNEENLIKFCIYGYILTSSGLVLLCINWCKFIRELWPLKHVRILFLLLITRMNRWNLTNSVQNVSILTCYKTSLDFVNISESVISGRLFLSYNGPGRGHLCHTDTFLVFLLKVVMLHIKLRGRKCRPRCKQIV